MKKKILGLLIAVFAFTMTIGTGFAAWVISKPAEEVKQGMIQVDTVSEDSLDITLSWGTWNNNAFSALSLAEGEPLLNLVAPAAESATANDWLTYKGTYGQRLEVVLKIEVARHSDHKAFSGTVYVSEGNAANTAVSLAAGEKLSVAIQSGVTANYLNAVVYTQGSAKSATTKETSGAHNEAYPVTVTNGVAYFTVTLSWGSYFSYDQNSNLNPYTYYNHFKADQVKSENLTYADDAKTVLQALHDMLGTGDTASSKTIGYTVYASASDATAWAQ